MQLSRDFQEFLNKEILKAKNEGIINEYYDALIEALNRNDQSRFDHDMQRIFSESVEKTEKKPFSSVNENDNFSSKSALDGEDDLIVGTSTIKDEEEQEEEIDIPDVLGDSEEVSDEELDEKYPQDDLSKNAKRYAYKYERLMKQYYKLKLALEKENIRKGEYSYDDKHFSQLMTLKEAAINYEIYFRNATNKKYFAVRDSIDSIKEMEEKNEIEFNKFQDENNRIHQKQNVKVDDIVNQIKACLKRIEELNEELQTASQDKKALVINELQQVKDMYIKLNKRLELIKPNPKQLANEEYKSNRQNEIEDKIEGIHYTKYVQRYADESVINNAGYNDKEKRREAKEEKLDSQGSLSSLEDAKEKIGDAKEEAIKSIDKELENGNLETASSLLGTYEKTYSKDFNDNDKYEIDEIKRLKEKIDETIKNNALGDRVKPSDQLATEDASSQEIMDELDKLSKGEKVSERQPDLGISR